MIPRAMTGNDAEPVQAAAESVEEKRKDRRRRTLKEGRVILSEWSTLDCTIRDMSNGGAHLRFSGLTTLPPSFRLMITLDRTVVPVDLLWQRGLSAGVAITGPAQPAPRKTSS